jgi:uncharacterized protein (TIGR03083 family)
MPRVAAPSRRSPSRPARARRFDPRSADPFPAYDREIARIRRYLHGLDETGWRAPSHCRSWSRKDLVSHLAHLEVYNEACLDGSLNSIDFSGGLNAHNERGVRERRKLAAAEVLAEWERRQKRVRRAWGRIGLEGKIETAGAGPYPLRLQAWHLAREYAIHSDDLEVPVAVNQREPRFRWRAEFGLFAAREEGEAIDARLLDGRVRVRARGRTEDLDLETFVAFVTNRPQQLRDSAGRRLLAALGKRG